MCFFYLIIYIKTDIMPNNLRLTNLTISELKCNVKHDLICDSNVE